MSPPSLSFLPSLSGPDPWSLPGPILGVQPSRALAALIFVPLLGAVWSRRAFGQRAQRLAAAGLLATGTLAAYLLLGRLTPWAAAGPDVSELVQPLWRVLSVQRLQLDVGLMLDRGAAALLVGWTPLAAWVALRSERRRAAWLCAAGAALALALLGDSLWTRLLGWEALSLLGWVLSLRRGAAVLWLARGGDSTLLVAAALLFWALGGSWSSSRLDSRYELDAPPLSVAAARTAARPAAAFGPTLALHGLPTELHPNCGGELQAAATRTALSNKLWPGGRVLGFLGAMFALAVALKVAASTLQLLSEWRVAAATSLLLWAATVLAGWHLLWRLR